MTVNPDEVLALLEAGPQPFAQLQAWLGSADPWPLRRALETLRRAGHVRVVGQPRHWALAAGPPVNGRVTRAPADARATAATGPGSWWTTPAAQADRVAFSQAQAAAHAAMRASKFGHVLVARTNTISGTDEQGLRTDLTLRRMGRR